MTRRRLGGAGRCAGAPSAALGAVVALATLVLAPSSANAAGEDDVAEGARQTAHEAVESGLFLNGMQPAAANDVAASAMGVAGFDGARHTPVFGAAAEVRLLRWLTLRGGVTYNPNDQTGDERSPARPAVGVRARVLEQARAGVDLSVAGMYRQERFAEDGGLFDLTTSFGRRFDRWALLGNLGAAMDPEGDDMEGQVGAAALFRATTNLHLGAQGFVRRDLGSTDPRRALENRESYDFAAGPVASYARDVFAFSLQAGVVGVRAHERAVGALVVGGLGAVF